MQFWRDLDPSKKRLIVVVSAIGTVILGMIAIGGTVENGATTKKRTQTVKRVLGDRDTREFGIQELQSKIKRLQKEKKAQGREQGRMKQELDALKKRTGSNAELTRQVKGVEGDQDKLRDDIGEFMEEMKTFRQELDDVRSETEKALRQANDAREKAAMARSEMKSAGGKRTAVTAVPQEVGPAWTGNNAKAVNGEDPMQYFAVAPLPSDQAGSKKKDKKAKDKVGIRIIGDVDEIAQTAEEENDDGVYIPAGSMLSGVLLNGMDAPTKTQASRNPFPATIRIQHEAILPNYYTADVRECFLIVSGYGELSSERTQLRGETISCVRDDGGVIESSIKGYATGEDGKAGVRGRLVSKSGQIIGQALKAGFLEGLAEGFQSNPVPVVQTSGVTSSPIFQQAFSEENLSNGVLSGSGKALERIADYYLSLAEEVFPVIEIDAGRKISFTLTKGTMLKFKSKAG